LAVQQLPGFIIFWGKEFCQAKTGKRGTRGMVEKVNTFKNHHHLRENAKSWKF